MKKISLKKYTLLVVIIISLCFTYSVTAPYFLTKQSQKNGFPLFSEYPATISSVKPATTPRFTIHPEARTFITKITEGLEEGPNFAGHYTVVTWGCGTSCESSAIVDALTGEVVVYGIVSAYGLSYQPTSTLLIVNPKENIPDLLLKDMQNYPSEHFPLGATPGAADYYVFKDGTLSYLSSYGFVTDKQRNCPLATSPARNPLTHEIIQFTSPCKIPYGWDALEVKQGTE